MKVKERVHALMIALPVLGLMSPAHSANLISNADFAIGTGTFADDWVQTTTNGWNNREISANGLDPSNYHMALGNAGASDNSVSQTLLVADGLTYTLSVDAGSPDAWWHTKGEAFLTFLDADSTVLASASVRTDDAIWAPDLFDTALPWQNYSVSLIAPAGTTQAVVLFENKTPDGGTTRFDNASLTAVPEPSTLGLFAIASLALLRRRNRR